VFIWPSLHWIYDKRSPSVSIYEQIVPRVVLEGWPLDMLVNPAERQQGIDFIAKECKYVTTATEISQFRDVDCLVFFHQLGAIKVDSMLISVYLEDHLIEFVTGTWSTMELCWKLGQRGQHTTSLTNQNCVRRLRTVNPFCMRIFRGPPLLLFVFPCVFGWS